MIRYTLICESEHQFDSWFKSFDAFENLSKAGHLSCSVCGSTSVSLALMAPAVQMNAKAPSKPDLKTSQSDVESAMTKMRQEVEANSEYVGVSFAQEARRMHDGDAPERAIYGEAKLDEAKKLIEDGVPVMPLPFMPKRKTN